jgi:hypothetical protein
MLGGNMSQFRPGDRVVRIVEYGVYNLPKYSRGVIEALVDATSVMVKFEDYSRAIGNFSTNLIPESLFDSPLYQALL